MGSFFFLQLFLFRVVGINETLELIESIESLESLESIESIESIGHRTREPLNRKVEGSLESKLVESLESAKSVESLESLESVESAESVEYQINNKEIKDVYIY